jgi:hypothetical protein
MEINGYRTQKKSGHFLFFKHGEKQGEISLTDIDKRIKIVENERRNTDQIKAIIHKYKKQYSGKLRSNHDHKFTTEKKKFESDLTNFLKQKFGLDFIFFTGKDNDKPYGYTIIDHHNKEVHKGSDVLKLDYLITDSVVNGRKNFETADGKIGAFQKSNDLFLDEMSSKVFNERQAGFEADENTSNNEIQLGDLFEDFIRELERENYESEGKVRKKRRRARGI